MATWHKVVDSNGDEKYMDDEDYKKYKNQGGCLGIIIGAILLIGYLLSDGDSKSKTDQFKTEDEKIEQTSSRMNSSEDQGLMDTSTEYETSDVSQKDGNEAESTEHTVIMSEGNDEIQEIEEDLTETSERSLTRKERRALKKERKRAEKEKKRAEQE